MIRLNWYKRYPKDFREGTRKLTFEERGFYGDVLDLIYEHGNDLLDDDEENAHMLRCSARVFRRLKARLVELGKLFVEGGRLRNGRADAEANAASIRIQTAREHAKLGGLSPKNRKGEPGDFNDMPEAGGQAPAEAPSREALKASRLLGETESLPAAAESTTRAPAYEAARPTAPPETAPAGPAAAAGERAFFKEIMARDRCDFRTALNALQELLRVARGDEELMACEVRSALHPRPGRHIADWHACARGAIRRELLKRDLERERLAETAGYVSPEEIAARQGLI
jgi:uncharacterized protein YdaU (DUF1376 family)